MGLLGEKLEAARALSQVIGAWAGSLTAMCWLALLMLNWPAACSQMRPAGSLTALAELGWEIASQPLWVPLPLA